VKGSLSLVQQFFQQWIAAQEEATRQEGRYRRGRRPTRSNEPKEKRPGSGRNRVANRLYRVKPQPKHTAALRLAQKKARPFVGKQST
jgi:hypothetical protein